MEFEDASATFSIFAMTLLNLSVTSIPVYTLSLSIWLLRDTRMFRLIYLSISLIVIILGVAFSVLNAENIQLNYYLGSVELPLSLVLVISMIVGAILGIFASLSLIIGSRRSATKLKRSVEVAEKEIVNLRNIPIKDEH